MVDDEHIWQDILPGDLILLPGGRLALVIAVMPGAPPATLNATVLVLAADGYIGAFSKAVLGDTPVVARASPEVARDLVSELQRVPDDPGGQNVTPIFESIGIPRSDAEWRRLSRSLHLLPVFGS